MAYRTSGNIWRSLVSTIRSDGALKAALIGGIHRGIAPEKVPYPFLSYNPLPTTYEDAWGSRMLIAVVDVVVFSENPVEADNLDQSTSEVLDGAVLSVEGQATLICRRVGDLSDDEVDQQGKKVYQIGGSYEIWTNQDAS